MRHVARQLRDKWLKLGTFIDASKTNVLARIDIPPPAPHPDPLHERTGVPEQGGETPADVVWIFPNEGSIIRLISVILLKANDEWQTPHRCLQITPMAELMAPTADAEPAQIATEAA